MIKAWINRLFQPKRLLEPPPESPSRDYAQERETTRAGALSAEDQAWQADTRQRDRAAHQRPQVADWESEGGAGAAGTRPRDGEG
jgi:hypothetical protein